MWAPSQGFAKGDKSYTLNHYIIVNRNETELISHAVNQAVSLPFSDTFVSKVKWESYSPFPGSNRTIMGHSFKIHWLADNAFKSTIENLIIKNADKGIPAMRNWFADNS